MSDLIREVEAFLANGGDTLDQEHEAALAALGERDQEWEEMTRRVDEALQKHLRDWGLSSGAKGTE